MRAHNRNGTLIGWAVFAIIGLIINYFITTIIRLISVHENLL